MRPLGDVYVFARAPQLGTVKRRLARDIGDVAAWRFHRETTHALLRRLAGDERWCTWLAITPDRRAKTAFREARGIQRIGQGPGDLGQRMARALGRDRTRPAIVVGSDIPDIGAAHIARAFDVLASHDAVFGPARDGGYWLVGVRDISCLPGLFRGVRWSSEHALADTLRNIDARRRVALIDALEDVDDGAAFRRWAGSAATRAAGRFPRGSRSTS